MKQLYNITIDDMFTAEIKILKMLITNKRKEHYKNTMNYIKLLRKNVIENYYDIEMPEIFIQDYLEKLEMYYDYCKFKSK